VNGVDVVRMALSLDAISTVYCRVWAGNADVNVAEDSVGGRLEERLVIT